MNLGTAQVIRANSRNLPLADNSVDLVVTSPPYWSLRSYQDAGEHYAEQIGDEPTPAEFVASLLEVTRECVRVLKPSGSLWVNLGDKYSGAQQQSSGRESTISSADYWKRTNPKATGVKAKSLYGIPWRYALACIDDLGLILRAEVIWSKPNGLPESVTDRVRRSHEQWFHFTLEPRYFSAVDEIREAHANPLHAPGNKPTGFIVPNNTEPGQSRRAGETWGNPLGKLPGSVWTIPTEPLRVPDHLGIDHFAAFPTEWPKRIIQGWSPAGVCVECGEGRRPVVNKALDLDHVQTRTTSGLRDLSEPDSNGRGINSREPTPNGRTVATITGYSCACKCVCDDPDCYGQKNTCAYTPAPTTPAVVLDPFGGTGTTAMVARALGRHGISVDMSADYCRLAEWRTNDRNQLAKVLGVAKVDAPDDGQLDLFDGGAA